MLLGMGSVEIALAFWLSVGASVLCLVYGLINWNRGGETDSAKTGGDTQ